MNTDAIVRFVVVLLIASILLPVGINALLDVDTSTWPTIMQTIWDNIPVIALAVFIIGVVGWIQTKRMGR